MEVFRKKWFARIMLILFLAGPGLIIISGDHGNNSAYGQSEFSLDKLEKEVEDAGSSIEKIVKVLFTIVAVIAGVFVVYNIMTNHPNAKNYGIGYVVGLIVIAIIWALFL